MKKQDKIKPSEGTFTPGHPYDYQKNAGIIDFIEDSGIKVRPTHSYQLLKDYQLELWNKYFMARKKEMKFTGVTFVEGDEPRIRKAFLESELIIFTGFLKGSNSDHNKMQIAKYIEDCQNEIGSPAAVLKKTNDQQLSYPQIALIHAYNGDRITAENSIEIANSYGKTAKTSGKKLYNEFCKYSRTEDRKGAPASPTRVKMRNKIKLLESVLPRLENTALGRAVAEIDILKGITETEY